MFAFEAVLNGRPYPMSYKMEPTTRLQAGAIAVYGLSQNPDLRLDSEIMIRTDVPWPVAGTVTVAEVLTWAQTSEAKEFFKDEGLDFMGTFDRLAHDLARRR